MAKKVKAGLRRSALFFREEQLQRLAILARETGASTAWQIRKAVDEWLEKRREEWEPIETREAKEKKK
jgi:hypothetical protein